MDKVIRISATSAAVLASCTLTLAQKADCDKPKFRLDISYPGE